MNPALRKTFDRTRRFVVEGLLWQGAARAYALVVWALLAGLLWLALDLLNVGSTTWSLLALELFLVAILAAVAAIDARFAMIPDSLILALVIGGLTHIIVLSSREIWLLQDTASEVSKLTIQFGMIAWRGLDALIAFLGAALLRAGYYALRGREGFGFGDVKFVGAAALWVGIGMVPLMLIVAVISAFGTIVLLRKQFGSLGGGDAIPFGPHLAVGLWLSVLVAGEINL